MNCVRCEIIRAKFRVFWLYNQGNGADEIIFDLNVRYTGVYFYKIDAENLEIRRKPVVTSKESVLIAAFDVAEWNLNDVVLER